MALKVLVCGDRNWSNRTRLYSVLDNFHKTLGIFCIVEGEARGADKMGREWAEARGVPFRPYPANWDTHHRAAGVIRNQQMLDMESPQEVLAFHNRIKESKGTRDMLLRAKREGIRRVLYTEDAEFINEEIET